jgi:tRNA pseudouridine55 synthase
MQGLLLVNKPKGWTSFDVVAKVRGMVNSAAKAQGHVGKIKVGHTGTLDPLATGLLVLAVGKYTKKVPELTKQNKTYEAQITLGATSTTDDAEGDITQSASRQPSEAEVKEALKQFVGEIQQVPPQFSAIKVGGVRAYASARRGKEVALQPRIVHVYGITNIVYTYPVVRFTCHVGSGTYIRSIARDLGKNLETGAYMSALHRTEVGAFTIAQAVPVDSLSSDTVANYLLA